MSGNAMVSGNTALQGGGIVLQSELIIEGNAKITGNTATQSGGGLLGVGDTANLNWAKDIVITDHITGNTAPKHPDTNFTFN
jgi:hypothetical protein